MTIDEAINKLNWALDNNTIENVQSAYEYIEAVELAIKALEQEPCEDVMAIHTQGLDESIRCAMCTNSMRSDRGCDGGCVVDEDMYKKVMDTIRNLIVPPVSPTFPKGTTNGI